MDTQGLIEALNDKYAYGLLTREQQWMVDLLAEHERQIKTLDARANTSNARLSDLEAEMREERSGAPGSTPAHNSPAAKTRGGIKNRKK